MIIEMVIPSILGMLSGITGTYVIFRYMMSRRVYFDIFDDLITEITTNIEYQKKIYMIGGLFGQGLKQGLGMGKRGGKFKWEDIAGELIMGFFNQGKKQGGTSESVITKEGFNLG